MFSVGILYLQFDKRILSGSQKKNSTQSPRPASLNSLSKSVIGIQMGLILLAMFVTRSSIASLQAKRGLPLGNQVVGWLILSTKSHLFPLSFLYRKQFKSEQLTSVACDLNSRIGLGSLPPLP